MDDVYRYSIECGGTMLATVIPGDLSGLATLMANVCPIMGRACAIYASRTDSSEAGEHMATVHADGGIDWTPLGSVMRDPARRARAVEMFS